VEARAKQNACQTKNTCQTPEDFVGYAFNLSGGQSQAKHTCLTKNTYQTPEDFVGYAFNLSGGHIPNQK
jgi:hypothetical protein